MHFTSSVAPATELTIRLWFFIRFYLLHEFCFVVYILIGVLQLELLNEKVFWSSSFPRCSWECISELGYRPTVYSYNELKYGLPRTTWEPEKIRLINQIKTLKPRVYLHHIHLFFCQILRETLPYAQH